MTFNDIEKSFVSVILPVYNASKTLSEAIDSILNQTYDYFELIIINDGSTDDSEKIILAYNNEKIKYYSNNGNFGLIYTLNKGIDLAKGKYIARMDADDISRINRIEQQVNIMDLNPDIIVCGTLIKAFSDACTTHFKYEIKENSFELKAWLIKYSCFAHPTVMIRRSTLVENQIYYNFDYKYAEDYKLWIDLSEFGDFYNIQEVLLDYRLSKTQVSTMYNDMQRSISRKCRIEYIAKVFQDASINADIVNSNIGIDTLTHSKKYSSNELLEVLYMSLSNYGIKEFVYFLWKLDIFKFSFSIQMAIIKRFVVGKNSVL